MSEPQLTFVDHPWTIDIVDAVEKGTIFKVSTNLPINGAMFVLDRNQMHLLKLWLEERLNDAVQQKKV